MAHECPECGQTCYCNGDIGDCCFNFEEDAIRCTHYKICEREDNDCEEWDEIQRGREDEISKDDNR